MKTLTLLVCLTVLTPHLCTARTWHITPDGTGDAPTIQAGIDSARTNDTIALANGTFKGPGNRDIEYLGKSIVVFSENGDPELCIIDCEGSEEDRHRGFCFWNGEGLSSVLRGVTITGGFGAPYLGLNSPGGAILCTYDDEWETSSPTIANCIFIDNVARGSAGGGIHCELSGALIRNCIFTSNDGGGVSINANFGAWRPTIQNCTFLYNSGMAVYSQVGARPTISGCTFYGNDGGVVSTDWGNVRIENTIITACRTHKPVESDPMNWGIATLTCCNIYGNAQGDWVGIISDQYGINGNFSACPSFCGATLGDFHLCDQSPCLPGNHPDGYGCGGLIGAWGEGCSCGPSQSEPTTWSSIKSMYR